MSDGTVVVGVLGAGTMGAGIAQVAAWAGHEVRLYDVAEAQLAKGVTGVSAALRKGAERGRHSPEAAEAAIARIHTTSALADLADCGLVVEAAPELIELKRQLFGELAGLVAPDAILASNTSTLSIASLARDVPYPERVCGMHFFNPAPLMPLVEVIRGPATSDATVASVMALATAWGKTPVEAADTPGFIVNRVARPYYGEALRLLGDGVADAATIDRLARDAGFPMGPFELMDLIGIDINFAAAQSVFDGYFQEPRFRPHPIQRQMVESGRLGRKTGQGYYRYDEGGRPVDAAPVATAASSNGSSTTERPQRLVVLGQTEHPYAADLIELLSARGHDVVGAPDGSVSPSEWEAFAASADAGIDATWSDAAAKARTVALLDRLLPQTAPLLTACHASTVSDTAAAVGSPRRVVGFGLLPPWDGRSTVELARGRHTDDASTMAAEIVWRALGFTPAWVGESVGLVLARIIACLANEAFFAVQEGVASAQGVDRAMQLGTRYPRGPVAWAELVGLPEVVATLDALAADVDPARYRAASSLRRQALGGLAAPSHSETAARLRGPHGI